MFTDTPEQDDPKFQHSRSRRLFHVAFWVLGTIVVLLLLGGLCTNLLLHNARFRDYALRTVEKRASESLGTSVHLQNFVLHLTDLSLDLYGLRIDGAAPYSNPPLLIVDHAQAGIRIVSLLSRKWYVNTIAIDRPIVRIYVDPNGISNIPTIKSSSAGSSQTSIFDLGIRRATLDGGEIYYNDKKSILSADLKEVDFHSSFDPIATKYAGTLSYANGHLISGTFQPIPHTLSAHFSATSSSFRMTNAVLTSGSSRLELTAKLDNFSNPDVHANYIASIDGSDLRQILGDQTIPKGIVRASGNFQYAQLPNQPALNAISLDGDVTSDRLDVRTPTIRSMIRNIAGHYSLASGTLVLKDLHANLLGGVLDAQGNMKDVAGTPHSEFRAELRGLSLSDLQKSLITASVPASLSLSGGINAQATASWGKNMSDLLAKADATMRGRVVGKNPDGSPATAIPIEGIVHGSYNGSSKQVALTDSYLQTPSTSLSVHGVLSDHSALNIDLGAKDLREIETASLLFRRPSPGHPVTPMGLSGIANFKGTLSGSTGMPHLVGHLTTTNVHFNGAATKMLRTDVDLSSSYASLANGTLDLEPHGRLAFTASTGLKHWTYTQTSPIQLDLNASQLDIAQVQNLAGQDYPVTGTLNLGLKVHGTQLHPIGDGDLSLRNVVAYQEPIKSIDLKFAGTGENVRANLSVDLPAGKVEGAATVYPQQRTYDATILSNGVHLEALEALKRRNISADGVLSIQMRGNGSFDNPQLNATMAVPQLIVQNQTIKSLQLKVNLTDHVALANLSTSAIGTGIQGRARVELAGDYMADATIDTQTIPLQPLVATYAPDQAGAVTGQTEIHATMRGPLKKTERIEAHVSVPVLNLGYTDKVQLSAVSPIQIDYSNRVVEIRRSAIRGTDTDLQFAGVIPTSGSGPMSLTLLGAVDLKLAQLFDPDVRSSGQLKFNIDSKGPVDAAAIGGEIDIVNASYATADLPVGLQRGNGVLTLTKDRINIAKFEGLVGGGKVTAQGGVSYRPGIVFDLGLSAQGIRALYPQGMRETVDANLRMTGTVTNALLSGNVNLAEISFAPAFDLNNFIGQFTGGVSPPPSPGFAQNLQLNIGLRSSNDIDLVSRTLSIGGSANLQVRGNAAQPVLLGRVNLTNGDLILNGDRFVLNGGTIQFVNPSETEPVVNVALNTTIQQYNIFLRFQGPVAQLHTEYSSDPALPSADIINLLAFGNTTEANSANPSTPPNQAAASLVASQVSSQVTSRISKVAGISQLSINPVLQGGSSQGPPGANITVQQRVTGNLFVTFSTNVASTQSQTVQGQYQVSPRVAVSATRNQNGGVAVDTIIKKTW